MGEVAQGRVAGGAAGVWGEDEHGQAAAPGVHGVGEARIDQHGRRWLWCLPVGHEAQGAVDADDQRGGGVPMAAHLAEAATEADALHARDEPDALGRFLKASAGPARHHGRHATRFLAGDVVTAVDFCLASAGGFFLAGLLAGAWKYHLMHEADARAPVYVDMAHRASLLYAFACALLAELIGRSAWPDPSTWALRVLVFFFAVTVLAYVVHGALRDTDNQFQRPHRLGRGTIPAAAMRTFMVLLVLAELGGFAVVFGGFLAARP